MTHDVLRKLARYPRARLATLPTPLHPLTRLTERLGGPEIWIKRDDLTGLAGGGNKTRRLEFLVGDALEAGADTLVTVGAIQSNHTRQTAAAAARTGLRCALLHNGWAPGAGPLYRRVGNILLSELLGAELYLDGRERSINDEGELDSLAERLRDEGRKPYVIPGGASDHPLGGLGYANAAWELVEQAAAVGVEFDHIVHCTGSSGTQAGLLAGLAALRDGIRVIGISDDDEVELKRERVLRIANATLEELDVPDRISERDVVVVKADDRPYGAPGKGTLDAIRLLAQTEGLLADPVYEGRAVQGLVDLIERRRLRRGERVLLLHLGGGPAVHAYAERFWRRELEPFGSGP